MSHVVANSTTIMPDRCTLLHYGWPKNTSHACVTFDLIPMYTVYGWRKKGYMYKLQLRKALRLPNIYISIYLYIYTTSK